MRRRNEIALISASLAFLIVMFMWRFFLLGQAFLPADIVNVRYPWSSYFLSSNVAITEPHNPLLSDSVIIYYPYAHFTYGSLLRGVVPLWNPYIYVGLPSDSLAWLSSPANIPFLFMPAPLAFGYSAALRLFLAGIFMYALIRKIGSGVLGAFVGSIVFMFNSNTVTWLSFPFHLSSELWIPLIFLLLVKTLSQRKFSDAILTGGILGLNFLAGYFQISLYLLLALAAYLIWTIVIGYRKSKNLSEVAERGFLFFIAISVGLLVGAVSIIPFKENIDLSIRAVQARGAGSGYPLPYILTFLVPNFFGNPADHNFWGPLGNYTEFVKYVGILPLILAAIALLFRRRQQETRAHCYFFSCVACLSILVALGGSSPLSPALSLLPYFYTSSPTRALSFFTFSVSILSGLGANVLSRDMHDAFRKELSRALKALLLISPYILILLALIVFVSLPGSLTKLCALIDYELWNVLQLVAWTGFSLGLLALFTRKALRRRAFCLLLVVLIVVNLFTAGIGYNTFVDPATVYPTTESTRFLTADHELYRILPVGGLSTFIPNSPAVYGISTIGGYYTLCTQRYWEYASLIDGAHITSNGVLVFTSLTESKLMDLLNVKYEVAPPDSTDPARGEDTVQDLSDTPVGEIWGSNADGQTFVSHYANLTAISIMMATYSRVNTHNTIFHLRDSPSSQRDIVTIAVNNSAVQNNAYYTLRFPPIGESKNKQFYFYLESPDSFPGDAITVWFSSVDAYPEGGRYLNGAPVQGDLRFRTFYEKPTNLKLVYDGEVRIYQNLAYLPRAFVVHQTKVITDGSAILKELTSDAFDPTRYVILEENVPNEMPRDQAQLRENSQTEVTSYSPSRIVINTNASTSGFLVLSDAYDSNWEAYVDGQIGKIYVADYILRAVYLDKGAHTVEFIYNPHVFAVLLCVSLSTLLIVVAVAILAICRPGFAKSLRRWPRHLDSEVTSRAVSQVPLEGRR